MRSFVSAALLLSGLCAAVPQPIEERRTFTGPSDPNRFKAYDTINKQGVICDSDSGPDGNTLWYQDLGASIMGYIDYKTELVKEFAIPWSHGSKRTPTSAPQLDNVTGLQCVVRLGKDGMIYGGAGIRNEIVQVNPRTNPPTFRIFAPPNQNPTGNLQNFNDAWAANQGLYFSQTTGNVVTLFNYKTHKFTSWMAKVPGSGPLGMRTDKHNNLWYTNFQGQYISKLDDKTKKITEYRNCCLSPQASFPEVLRSSTENEKYLWANSFGGGGYIRIEPAQTDPAKIFKIFTNPDGAGSFPFENVNDYCGRIWYSSPTMNKVYYYDPKLAQWTTVTVPAGIAGTPMSGSFEVTMHRGPGHFMWFTQGTNGKIVRYTLDPDCFGEPQ